MDAALLLDRVLDDEGITAGLDEADATILVETLSTRVRRIAAAGADERLARKQVDELCRNGRKIAEVVATFRDLGEATARRTAQRHGFRWPEKSDTPATLLRRLLASDQ